jgi:predicted nucleotidyltransferase
VIDYLNTVVEISKQRNKYFRNYKHYATLIKDAVGFSDTEVVVFGSVPDGEYTTASDIDVLVISDHVPVGLNERAKILSKINKVLGDFHPFELHLVTKKEAEWYKGLTAGSVKV